jgi:hypothetical protein
VWSQEAPYTELATLRAPEAVWAVCGTRSRVVAAAGKQLCVWSRNSDNT